MTDNDVQEVLAGIQSAQRGAPMLTIYTSSQVVMATKIAGHLRLTIWLGQNAEKSILVNLADEADLNRLAVTGLLQWADKHKEPAHGT